MQHQNIVPEYIQRVDTVTNGCGSDNEQAMVITIASNLLTLLGSHCSVGIIAPSKVWHYQRHDSVPRNLPVPHTKNFARHLANYHLANSHLMLYPYSHQP